MESLFDKVVERIPIRTGLGVAKTIKLLNPIALRRERKRMLGLLIEDVTLIKKETITAQVRFRGGATTTLTLPLPLNAWQGRMTPDATLHQMDELLEEHTDSEVATILNERGLKTGAGATT